MNKANCKEYHLGELARLIDGELIGAADRVIRGVNTLLDAGEDEISFLANPRYEKYMSKTSAGAVIVGQDYVPSAADPNLIKCRDPYFAFKQLMVEFYGYRKHPLSGISSDAWIDPTAKIAEDVIIAPFVTVSAEAEIASGTILYPGVFIGPRCKIGRDCVLYPNVVLYEGTILGNRVTIHAGSVIGEDGFGYATHQGKHEKIPQIGHVEIQDDVEIGACCTIDRATIGATVIGEGTKFSNLIAIGHGSRIGRNCLLVAQVGIAGSTTIGDFCSLAGQCGVVGHVNIGDGVRVGAQAGVTNDIRSGMEVLGSPAVPLRQARKIYTLLNQLPELRQTLKDLSSELAELKKQVEKLTNQER